MPAVVFVGQFLCMDIPESDNAACDSSFGIFNGLSFQTYPFVFVVGKTPQQLYFDRVFIVLSQCCINIF